MKYPFNISLPTRYNGYHFRSRLEARWAIFFESMGIKYYYEFEDYWLPESETRYLPDFYLPDYQGGCLAEVKGSFKPHEINKCRELAQLTGLPVLMLEGVPDLKLITSFMVEKVNGVKRVTEWIGWLHERGSLWIEGEPPITNMGDYDCFSDRYHKAVMKSRAARFEFKE